jgi:hypothetical protein
MQFCGIGGKRMHKHRIGVPGAGYQTFCVCYLGIMGFCKIMDAAAETVTRLRAYDRTAGSFGIVYASQSMGGELCLNTRHTEGSLFEP